MRRILAAGLLAGALLAAAPAAHASSPWQQAYYNDFNHDYSPSAFQGCTPAGCPDAPFAGVGATVAGTPDRNHVCIDDPSRTVSIHHSVLTIKSFTDLATGRCYVANLFPQAPHLTYARLWIRFRASTQAGYHFTGMLWPVNNTDGELDAPEGNNDGEIHGFYHEYGGGAPWDTFPGPWNDGRWHVLVLAWTPNAVTVTFDGRLLPEVVQAPFGPPSTPHRLVLREESHAPVPWWTVGVLQVDKVVLDRWVG